VKDYPHSGARPMMLSEPRAPFCARADIEKR
jgi:hypothetical protein